MGKTRLWSWHIDAYRALSWHWNHFKPSSCASCASWSLPATAATDHLEADFHSDQRQGRGQNFDRNSATAPQDLEASRERALSRQSKMQRSCSLCCKMVRSCSLLLQLLHYANANYFCASTQLVDLACQEAAQAAPPSVIAKAFWVSKEWMEHGQRVGSHWQLCLLSSNHFSLSLEILWSWRSPHVFQVCLVSGVLPLKALEFGCFPVLVRVDLLEGSSSKSQGSDCYFCGTNTRNSWDVHVAD